MRDAGGELSQRGQAVAVQQLFLRGLELLGALLDLGLELLRELVDLAHGGAQPLAHDVEGARQLVELLAAADDVDGLVEFHGADRLGALDQLLDGPAEEAAREIDDEEADQRDLDAGDQQDAVLHAGDFAIHAVETELQVEHAEHLHAGGMGVAFRLAAGRLVVDAG